MTWTDLPTDYKDAVWKGNRKYVLSTNSDGTVSFEDKTEYTQKENSFFGAAEANQMNNAMNVLAKNITSVETNAKTASDAATTATQKATAAGNSASAAASSQQSAASSASSAESSAATATNKASAASSSASAAATSATNASNSATAAQTSAERVAALLFNNAGAHNAIYRGKSLGSSVTSAQYASISGGTFEDLYIGDYWTIGGVNYRIAAFDYYLNSGDSNCTTHHAVIVPDSCLYNATMNSTNTTAGGYVGSAMYTSNLANAKTTIKNAFSGHVLKHRTRLINAVSNGAPSASAWCDSEVDLMTERMVYGNPIFSPMGDGQKDPWSAMHNYTVEKSQLPLFQLEPSRISNRNNWWLRDVVTASLFALVNYHGNASYNGASASLGVRPAFCIS